MTAVDTPVPAVVGPAVCVAGTEEDRTQVMWQQTGPMADTGITMGHSQREAAFRSGEQFKGERA